MKFSGFLPKFALSKIKTNMKKFYAHSLVVALALIAMLGACSKGKTFQVEGEITSADDQTLYLEQRDLAGVTMIDSVKLNENGSFKFKHTAPENPEFFQLRIGDKVAAFAVDSIETLSVKGDAADFYNTFAITGSPTNDQVRQVDALTQKTASQIDELEKQHAAKTIDDVSYITLLDSALNTYKTEISKMILGNPSSAAAYYAVFQKIDNYLIFDPYDKKDYAMFGAVATSWSRYYPETPRTKHLYDFTMNALRARKKQEQTAQLIENAPVVDNAGLPDIELMDMNGSRVSLSSLKGKVVLLDFTVYNSEFSPKHTIDLNAVYTQYKSSGFEIYQVSIDSDEHFWKNAANNLPWITVRDPRSVNSALLSTYNVRQLPTAFILNKEGDVVARIENYATLRGELAKVL